MSEMISMENGLIHESSSSKMLKTQREIILEICCKCKKSAIDKKPKFLPCLHTICQPCLDDICISKDFEKDQQQLFKCPSCDLKCNKNQLMPNFLLETTPICPSCESSPISFRCLDCPQQMCENCRTAHLRVSLTSGHRVEPELSNTSKSDTDDVENIPCMQIDCKYRSLALVFCDVCKQFICCNCAMLSEKHKPHLGKVTQTPEKVRGIKNHIEKIGAKLKKEILEIKKNNEETLNEKQKLACCKNRAKSELKKQKDAIQAAIQAKYLEMEKKIDGAYSAQLGKVEEASQSIKNVVKMVQQSSSICDAAMDVKNPVNVALLAKTLCQALTSIRSVMQNNTNHIFYIDEISKTSGELVRIEHEKAQALIKSIESFENVSLLNAVSCSSDYSSINNRTSLVTAEQPFVSSYTGDTSIEKQNVTDTVRQNQPIKETQEDYTTKQASKSGSELGKTDNCVTVPNDGQALDTSSRKIFSGTTNSSVVSNVYAAPQLQQQQMPKHYEENPAVRSANRVTPPPMEYAQGQSEQQDTQRGVVHLKRNSPHNLLSRLGLVGKSPQNTTSAKQQVQIQHKTKSVSSNQESPHAPVTHSHANYHELTPPYQHGNVVNTFPTLHNAQPVSQGNGCAGFHPGGQLLPRVPCNSGYQSLLNNPNVLQDLKMINQHQMPNSNAIPSSQSNIPNLPTVTYLGAYPVDANGHLIRAPPPVVFEQFQMPENVMGTAVFPTVVAVNRHAAPSAVKQPCAPHLEQVTQSLTVVNQRIQAVPTSLMAPNNDQHVQSGDKVTTYTTETPGQSAVNSGLKALPTPTEGSIQSPSTPDNEESSDDDDITENPSFCAVCRLPNEEQCLLACDACDRIYHTGCHIPGFARVPGEDFFCHLCTNKPYTRYEKKWEQAKLPPMELRVCQKLLLSVFCEESASKIFSQLNSMKLELEKGEHKCVAQFINSLFDLVRANLSREILEKLEKLVKKLLPSFEANMGSENSKRKFDCSEQNSSSTPKRLKNL